MRHEGDAVLDQPVVGNVARDPAHPAIAARARRQLPVPHRAIDPQLEHEIAKPAALHQMAREPVAVVPRGEHGDQRRGFERIFRLACRRREPRGDVAQIAARIDGPQPVGRMLLVVIQ